MSNRRPTSQLSSHHFGHALACLVVGGALGLGCPAKNPDAAEAPANPHAANPHAANPHAANPHAANPHAANPHAAPVEDRLVQRPDEKHLQNVRQLTNGGENAEAYLDATGLELIFQAKREGMGCDQIYRMGLDGKNERKVSVGDGRTTCSYIQPDNSIVYASTHGHGPGCLKDPDRSQGYVWALYPEFDIFRADADGKNASVLFQSDRYDAEATACHKDGRLVFTSLKTGDLELYVMDKDGQNVTQLTTTPGYDGGAFFSEDCSKIVWRASRPEGDGLADYQRLLGQNLVRPTQLEIFVADFDAATRSLKNTIQVTKNGKANFAPYLHPDNKRVLYVSNKGDEKGRDFDIYLVNLDGTGEERVTTNPSFDGFPMFSPDGKKLVFSSNRANAKSGETNVFVADWVD